MSAAHAVKTSAEVLSSIGRDAVRPYRFYNASIKKWVAYRYYTHKINAMNQALILCKWMPIDSVLEVVDVRNGRLHGQYHRRVNHVEFLNESLVALPKKEKYYAR